MNGFSRTSVVSKTKAWINMTEISRGRKKAAAESELFKAGKK